jgi:hypothetical protein
MSMEGSRYERLLDYYPILSYAGFWLQGAFIGAILTGDARLMKLGFVTLPAICAMVAAAFRIHKKHKEQTAGGGEQAGKINQ